MQGEFIQHQHNCHTGEKENYSGITLMLDTCVCNTQEK